MKSFSIFPFISIRFLFKYFESVSKLDYSLNLLPYLSLNPISPNEKLGVALGLSDCVINPRYTGLGT